MDYKKRQLVSMAVAAIAMVIVIILAIIANQPRKSDHKRTRNNATVTTTEQIKETETTETTTEEVTEAPTDTSDWEMQPAEEDTPDTGERIKD